MASHVEMRAEIDAGRGGRFALFGSSRQIHSKRASDPISRSSSLSTLCEETVDRFAACLNYRNLVPCVYCKLASVYFSCVTIWDISSQLDDC